MFNKTVIYQCQYPLWINVKDQLPAMFADAIVWGCIPTVNVMRQAYQARRWTGCNHAFDVEGEKMWGWYTPTDGIVADVIRWMPMPATVLPQHWINPETGQLTVRVE